MKPWLLVAAVVVLSSDQCGDKIPPEIVQQRQALVDLCVERGGIPILDAPGQQMVRCDFPPVAPIIRLPEVGQ